jgi:protein HIRA/HIR1
VPSHRHSRGLSSTMGFGFTPPLVPEGFSHVSTRSPTQMTPPPLRPLVQMDKCPQLWPPRQRASRQQMVGVNILVAKRGNKKRATLSHAPSGAVNGAGSSVSAPPSKRVQLTHHQDTQSFPSPSEQPFNAPDSWSRHADVSDAPIDSLDTTPPRTKRRRAAIGDSLDDVKPPRVGMLGGDRRRQVIQVKRIGTVVPMPSMAAHRSMMLPVPPLLTYITSEVEGTDDVLEVENAEDVGEQ